MQCSYRLGLIRLILIVPLRMSSSVILMEEWKEHKEAGCCNSSILCDMKTSIHPITCATVLICNASRVCISCSRPCLPQTQTCSLKSPRRTWCFTLLLFKQPSPFEVQHEAFILLSCYFIVFPRAVPCNTQRGATNTRGPSSHPKHTADNDGRRGEKWRGGGGSNSYLN